MKNFIKVKENFTCQNCGRKVTGNGYTDHCPHCLWGKHADLNIPGDRASLCHGLLEPKRVIYERGQYRIYYQCTRCSHQFRVWADKSDSGDTLLSLVTN